MGRSAAQPLLLRLRGGSGREEAGERAPAVVSDERVSARRIWPVIVGCFVISALTLLLPSTPTYDPWAWILWGREITQLDLNTIDGPSWKPLPVIFTTVFALFGEDVAPLLWVWVGRAGGLLSLVMAFRLTRRLLGDWGWAGWIGGLAAALFLATGYNYARDVALGVSEPLLAALVLWAVERHLDGRRDHALYLGFAGALLRPEVWPFLGLYGLWLMWREPHMRLRVVLVGLAIPALWFLPELWGSGDALRASNRANAPNPLSAAFADHPGLEVLNRFHNRTVWAILVAAGLGLLVSVVMYFRSRAQRPTLFVAGVGLLWLLLVAVMTEAGYAGNTRYAIASTAAICVLGGMGMARIFQGIRGLAERLSGSARVGLAGALLAFLLLGVALNGVIAEKVDNFEFVADNLQFEASLWEELPGVIEEAGGAEALVRCGGVYSGPFQTQLVAYELGLHGANVSFKGTPSPGVAFQSHTTVKPEDPLLVALSDDRFRRVATSRRWAVSTVPRDDAIGDSCPAAGPNAPRAPAQDYTPELTSSR